MTSDLFRVKEFGLENKKIVFFFTGMGTRRWLYTWPINRMVKQGFRVVTFDFEPLIVHKRDPDTWLNVIEAVVKTVREIVNDLKQSGINDFSVFGFSMGTLPAIKSAATIPEIQKAVIMLTYGSVAENVWSWWFIRPAKIRALKLGYTMTSLDKKLAPLTPVANAPKLKGKKLLLYISHKDKIIPYEQASQFKDALESAGVDFTLIENKRFGHNLSGLNNFRNDEVWLDFLG